MLQHHEMDISVRQNGEIKVEVHYKGRVPNLLARFPVDVQLKARSLFWLPTPYERKLWKAARGMPHWARETIRQHILQERAERLLARRQRVAEAREANARRRQAGIVAVQRMRAALPARRVQPPRTEGEKSPVASASRPVADRGLTLTSRLDSGAALSSVPRPSLTLTQAIAAPHAVPLAVPPRPLRAYDRSR